MSEAVKGLVIPLEEGVLKIVEEKLVMVKKCERELEQIRLLYKGLDPSL
jgi:hypothetical protein